jgi:TLC ATP/ADP transporter
MGSGMSLHFGAYEFIRNAGLALFTSTAGFPSAAAFPFAYGLISPISVGLLYLYSLQLEKEGPRATMYTTTKCSIVFILISAAILQYGMMGNLPIGFTRAVIGLAFLFQNSYVFMLASQQWSFMDSIVTPYEGAQWFGFMAGVSSVVCTITASLVPILLPITGLIGLYAVTALPLLGTLWFGDRAYQLAQVNGFDPARQQEKKKPPPPKRDGANSSERSSRTRDALALFRRVPTLGALFAEGISFQSLNTILNVAMVQALKLEIPNDVARSAFTGRFYALVSAVSAAFQFVILPLVMKRLEPKQIWRIMPIIPFLVSLYQVLPGSSVSLRMLSGALFLTKLMDYSLRSVVYNMVYQPLDFESRFVGKEIIGVFGSRFGKSGISLLLSGLTASGLLSSSLWPLSMLSLILSSSWVGSTFWLSSLLPSKDEAQRTVVERARRLEEHNNLQKNE